MSTLRDLAQMQGCGKRQTAEEAELAQSDARVAETNKFLETLEHHASVIANQRSFDRTAKLSEAAQEETRTADADIQTFMGNQPPEVQYFVTQRAVTDYLIEDYHINHPTISKELLEEQAPVKTLNAEFYERFDKSFPKILEYRDPEKTFQPISEIKEVAIEKKNPLLGVSRNVLPKGFTMVHIRRHRKKLIDNWEQGEEKKYIEAKRAVLLRHNQYVFPGPKVDESVVHQLPDDVLASFGVERVPF